MSKGALALFDPRGPKNGRGTMEARFDKVCGDPRACMQRAKRTRSCGKFTLPRYGNRFQESRGQFRISR